MSQIQRGCCRPCRKPRSSFQSEVAGDQGHQVHGDRPLQAGIGRAEILDLDLRFNGVAWGEACGRTRSAIARSSGSGWLVTCTATGVLRLFEWLTSDVLFDELARNHTKNLPPAAAKPFGRDGSVNESTSCSTLFCESGGAWIVPSETAPLVDLAFRQSKTVTVVSGASAVLVEPYGEPGVGTVVASLCERGSVIVLAPMFCRIAETSSTPPQAALGPACPVIVRSGSEKPSEENARRARDSSCSGAAIFLRGTERVCAGPMLGFPKLHRTPPIGRGPSPGSIAHPSRIGP